MGANNNKKSGNDPKGMFQNTAAEQTQRFNNQQGPMVDAMAFNYGRGTEANYGDYTDIMNQYRGIASGSDAADYSGGEGGGGGGGGGYSPFTIGYNDPFKSYTGYEDFSNTGGYSESDMANMRARGVSPIRAAYANAEREVGRQRSLQGGYAPNAIATQAKMAREQGQAMSDATTNVEAGLAEARNKGRLSGLSGMAGIENQRLGADLDVAKYNADAQARAQAANNAAGSASADRAQYAAAANMDDRFRALSGMTSMYGATPGMSNTFGNQLLQGVNQAGSFGLGMTNAQVAGQQLPGAWEQGMGRINDVADIFNTGMTAGNAFLRNRSNSGAGGVGTTSPAAQSGQRSAFGGTTMGPTNTGYNPQPSYTQQQPSYTQQQPGMSRRIRFQQVKNMAYDINRLRQQGIFDQYGMMSMPMMDMFGSDGYSEGDQTARLYHGPPAPPQMPDPSGPIDPYSLGGTRTNIPAPEAPRAPTVGPQSEFGIEDIMGAINRVYTPDTVSRDRFNNLLDTAPEREEPSFMRRLVAAGVGLGNKGRGLPGGIEQQEKVLYAPYMRDMAEWTAKTDPFGKAAQFENTANANERQLAGNVVAGVVNAERAETQARTAAAKQDETNRSNLAKEEIQRTRAAAYDFKARNPGAKFDFSGPEVMVADPITGQVRSTGLKTGHMTDLDKINLNQDNTMAQIQARGDQARQTNAAPGGSSTTSGEQQFKDRQGMLKRIYSEYPDYREFIKEENGVYVLVEPSNDWNIFSDDADNARKTKWYELNKALNPSFVPPAPKNQSTPSGGGSNIDQIIRQNIPVTGTGQQSTIPKVSPNATQGLGPQNVPSVPSGGQGRFGSNPIGSIMPSQTYTPEMRAESARQDAEIKAKRAVIATDPKDGSKHFLPLNPDDMRIAYQKGWTW